MQSLNGEVHSAQRTLILYGTETGNSQDLAFEIGQCLERIYLATDTEELDAVSLQDLVQYDLVVFAISTTGQGDFPSNARKFWQKLLRKKLTATSLSKVTYALVGLCDSSYPKFNLAARKLHKRLQQLGAHSLLSPCEADEQGEEGTEGAFLAWLPLFQTEVLSRFPLNADQSPIPPNQRLPSPWILRRSSFQTDQSRDVRNGTRSWFEKTSQNSIEASFSVVLEQNERVTPSAHWQDVRMLRLRTDTSVNYMPGDALAIQPENSEEDVEQLINLQSWQEVANIPLTIKNVSNSPKSRGGFSNAIVGNEVLTLRQLLTKHLDIKAIPRRSFFHKISFFTEDEMQKERALEFTDPQYLDEYFDYATRPRRSILEVLQEFDTIKIPWEEAINIFPLMRPRQFSIASGGHLKQNGLVFELLVAIVKYRTVIKRIREGVCTKYLARLPLGTRLGVVLHTEGRLHDQPLALESPHLLIGGGTGIAPLRSIIYEQDYMFPRSAKSILIFGCRNSRSDFFFESEWSKFADRDDQLLRVIPAFSRDQENKVYVQDRIREHAHSLLKFFGNSRSMVVVCGSSGAMPKAVRLALKDVLASQKDLEEAQEVAEEELLRIEKEGRYKQETW